MLETSSTNKIIGNTYSVVVPDIYEKYKIDGDAEVFETVALDYLLTKHSDDTELIEYIMSLPKRDKRMATLLAIDGDNVLWSKMNSFVNDCVDKMEHIKDIVKIINQFVKDGEVERKKYGEVMTPITLVREMLDTLPKEVWSNPNLKWLDPANGAGTFPFVVIYKLMNGLKNVEGFEDVEFRYKHIVENMIYTCELQSRNVALWLCGVDPKDEYTTNTYWGSFLDDAFDYHMKNVWNVEKFDIIIGNPPYQHPTNKRWKLWVSFLDKISRIKNKYLLFVTPNAWMNSNGEELDKAKNIITSKGINTVNINVNNYFIGVGEDIGYYFCDGEKRDNITIINDSVRLTIVNDGEFIVSDDDRIKNSIFKKLFSNEKFIYKNVNTDIKSKLIDGSFSKERSITNTTRVIHSASNIFYCSDNLSALQKEGVIINWSGHFYKEDDNKYLFRSIEDVSGRNTKKVLTNNENESNKLISYISSKLIRFFVNSKKTSGFNTILADIPKIDISRNWSDKDLYKHFDISEEEIELIERTIK